MVAMRHWGRWDDGKKLGKLSPATAKTAKTLPAILSSQAKGPLPPLRPLCPMKPPSHRPKKATSMRRASQREQKKRLRGLATWRIPTSDSIGETGYTHGNLFCAAGLQSPAHLLL